MKEINILYVDDEFFNLMAFQSIFERDFKIFIATDKEECLDILKSNKIEIIFCDQRMPLITGVELLNYIKTQYPAIKKRIILSGYIDDIQIKEGIKNGIIDMAIEKPFNKQSIIDIINNADEKK